MKFLDSKYYFERHIIAMLFLCLIDTVAFLCGIDLPMGLMYGPLAYLAYKSVKRSSVSYTYLHIFPFLWFLFFYVILYFGKQFSIHWFFNIQQYYNYGFIIVLPVSLLVYSLAVLLEKNPNGVSKEQFVKTICKINFCSALFAVLPVVKMIWPQFNIGFNPGLAIYGFNGIVVLVTSYYLFFLNKEKTTQTGIDSSQSQLYAGINSEDFKVGIKECLLDSKLYLNGTLTLKLLAEKMDLPKHQLSYLLNTYFDKSFYRLIADYRVEYAKKRLDEDNIITIEELAYECGFNSKTSLNKYFKELTGFSPSQYRSDIASKQLSLR